MPSASAIHYESNAALSVAQMPDSAGSIAARTRCDQRVGSSGYGADMECDDPRGWTEDVTWVVGGATRSALS
eukprot:6190887-Pleurochrysis_carterae.AAC.5